MPSYNDQPPSISDLSAADEVSLLITDALVVKTLLADAVTAVRRVDSIAGTHLSKSLESIDQRYLDLLNISRASATGLNAVIRNFVEVIVPLSEHTDYPLAKRVQVIKKSALKIETGAQANLAPYDQQLARLKQEIKSLVDTLATTSQNVKKESDTSMKEIETQIADLAADVKANHDVTQNLGTAALQLIEQFAIGGQAKVAFKPSPVNLRGQKSTSKPVTARPAAGALRGQPTKQPPHSLGSTVNSMAGSIGALIGGGVAAVGGFNFLAIFGMIKNLGDFFNNPEEVENNKGELDAKVAELASVKKEAGRMVAEIEGAVQEASTLANSFSGLDGRLGHFDVIWNKIAADSNDLSAYLESESIDEQAMVERVKSEAEVYRGLRKALDDYALRVTA